MTDLSKLAQSDYKAFNERLIKTKYPILGVRLPAIKAIAKNSVSDKDILEGEPLSHEEILLKGFVVALSPCTDTEFFERIDAFLNHVDNWATCDSFCMSLKRIKKIKGSALEYFIKYKDTDDEYRRRFLAVLLMGYYLDTHMDLSIDILLSLINGKYYTDMAVAWALATVLAKDFNQHEKIFSSPLITPWIKSKTISKAVESFRLSQEQKQILRQMRIKCGQNGEV